MKRLLACALVMSAAACDCGPGGATSDPKGLVHYVGRLALADDQGCTSAVPSFEAHWPDCHDFKRRFNAMTGAHINPDAPTSGALRPLPATIEMTVIPREGSSGSACSSFTFQTDLNGVFNVSMPGCGTGLATLVVARVFLQYDMVSPDSTRVGHIRGLWQDAETLALLPGVDTSVVGSRPAFKEYDPKTGKLLKNFRLPEFVFTVPIDSEPPKDKGSPLVNLGTQVYGTGASDDTYHYIPQVLIGWANVVELHHRLHDALSDEAAYHRMFLEAPTLGASASYFVIWDDTWPNAGAGSMRLLRPNLAEFAKDPKGSFALEGLLSATAVLSHEFGHSVHSMLASNSFSPWDYNFASLLRAPGATADYSWGHGADQYQELGVSFNEGWASALGQYLVGGCRNANPKRRPEAWPIDPFSANKFSGDASCDASAGGPELANNGCGMHHVRWNLLARGVKEGSPEWNTALTRLRALTQAGVDNGHRWVSNNNEYRLGEFVCDLLDDDGDVSFAAGIDGKKYVRNFTRSVADIFDGKDVTATIKQFSVAPSAEHVKLSLSQLIKGTGEFCPDCSALKDKFGETYNNERIDSYTGKKSAIALGRYLVSEGLLTDAELKNLLKSNYMEEDY